MGTKGKIGAAGVLALTASLFAAAPASAATVTWDGSGGSSWSNAANWVGDVAPVDGDDVVLNTNGVNPSNYDLAGGIRLASVTLVNGSADELLTVSGNPIALADGGSITNQRSGLGNFTSLNGGVTLSSGATFTQSDGASRFDFHDIGGAGQLTLEQNSVIGVMRLQGAGTYTGATVVNGTGAVIAGSSAIPDASEVTVNGELRFEIAATIGSLDGVGTVGSNSVLTVGGNGTSTTFSGIYQDLNGTASLAKEGAGTFTLSGANTYAGPTTVTDGTLRAGAINAFSSSSAHTVAAGATVDVNSFNETIGSLAGAGNVTLGSGVLTTGGDGSSTSHSGVVSGIGGLAKQGAGAFTLTGNNTYSGGTTLANGAIGLGSNTALGTGGVSLAGAAALRAAANGLSVNNAIDTNGNALTVDTQGNALTHSGAISGNGSLTKTGTGTLTLPNSNIYTGGTTLAGGAIGVGSDGSLGFGALTLNDAGSLVAAATGVNMGNPVSLGANTLMIDAPSDVLTLTGDISGTGALTKAGAGFLRLGGQSSYDGPTQIDAGVLRASGENALSEDSTYSIAGGATLLLDNGNQRVGALAGAGNVDLGPNSVITGLNDATTTFSGTAAGTGGLFKTGAGTFTVSGANTYTGVTNVSEGTLALTGSLTSDVTADPGGTLAGTGSTAGNVTVDTGGTLSPGTSIGSLTANGNVDFASGADFEVELASGGVADRLNATGNVDLGGADLDLSLLGGYTHTPGTVYTIVDSDNPINGTFAGPATFDVDGHRFRLDYATDPNKVLLLAPRATPAISGTASPDVELGGQVSDTASLAGGDAPTGQVEFKLYGPGDANCSGAPVFTDAKSVSGNGDLESSSFTPTEPGTYRWTASYSGDANNDPATTGCGDASQSVTVSQQPPTPDPPVDPTLEITDVELDRKRGTATLTVLANVPGQLHVAKSNKVKPDGPATLDEAGTAELEVVPRNKAAKTLERKGRLKVNPKVILNTAAGGELLARQELKLRKD